MSHRTQVLFLGGVFARENEAEVIEQSKKGVEFSANNMQMKLIDGLKSVADTTVLSAPFIGSFPNRSTWFHFRGFSSAQDLCKYVSFNNVWGFRNISRARALKRNLSSFIRLNAERKMIVAFSAHAPFLVAAAYAKKKDPGIRVCFVVPDMPQYMNLEQNRSKIYDICKHFDIALIQKHIKIVDSSVVLTDAMASALMLKNRPYTVVEGVIADIAEITNNKHEKRHDTVNILYAGKLYYKFGVKNLVEAFVQIPDNNYRLILCGSGDLDGYIKSMAALDSRIIYAGQVSPQQVQIQISDADVLVNPRRNDDIYTSFSFPSKNIEYLLSGKPLVAYMLDGMPVCYKDFIYEIRSDKDSVVAIKEAILMAANDEQSEIAKRYSKFYKYALEHFPLHHHFC